MVTQSALRSVPGGCWSAWLLVLLLAGVVALAACAPRRPEPPQPPPAAVPAERRAAPLPAGAQQYVIDPEGSIVTIRVYRAGPLARLGHNHVITSVEEAGTAWTNGELAGSGFEIRVPVASLVVDDPTARQAAGPDFPGDVPEDARAGTRGNMLRPEVLNVEVYPEIVVRADALTGNWEAPVALARMSLRDRILERAVPLAIARGPTEINARGAFRVLQSDFGITPFSVAGGAIQVADGLEVTFEIRAVVR